MKCSICYEITIAEKLILQCNHTFHKKCIKMWFNKNNYKLCKNKLCQCTDRFSSCPLCRTSINLFYLQPKYKQLYEYCFNNTRRIKCDVT